MPDKLQRKSSTKHLTRGDDISRLAADEQSYVFTKYVGELSVKPEEQPRISLGVFGADHPAKGFSVELTPLPDPEESIVADVLYVGSPKRYELLLHVANYGDKTVRATVWQMADS